VSSRRIIFRCDASSRIGSGHLIRCTALAHALGELGIQPVMASAELGASDEARLVSAGIEVLNLPKGEQQAGVLAGVSGEALVLDHYHLQADYLDRWHETGRPVLQLIDSGEPRPGVSIALNQNLGAQIPERRGLLRLEGLDYALLRPVFQRGALVDLTAPVRRCLVTLGAADADGYTRTVLELMESLARRRGLTLVTVVGGLNPHADQLRRYAHDRPWIELHENVAEMATLMRSCQVALSTSGSTLWELCAVGLPRVVFSIAANQRPLAHQAATRELAVDLGWANTLKRAEVEASVEALVTDLAWRERQVRHGRQLVDGRGAQRVAKILMEAL